MSGTGQDRLKARRSLRAGAGSYDYYALDAVREAGIGDISRLPYSMKVLLENLLRHEDGRTVAVDDIEACAAWLETRSSTHEIAFHPARTLLQDFTGVPAVVDLAAMRQAMADLGGDPQKINPLATVDLVIDHSVMVDSHGSGNAFAANVDREFERNQERYSFLHWGSKAFSNFRVVPPGTGICHQVNLEYLAQTVWTREDGGRTLAYPDTLVGTDSHTTMINGLSVLGWGVGGIEAEAAMLGQPISMLLPEVIGFRFEGTPREGTTATDIVLTVTQMLRARGVVGKFVEFYGPGLDELTLADRATIANMAPEYGATCGFFPIDAETCAYMRLTGRDDGRIALVEAYARAQGLWRDADTPDPEFTDTLSLDLGSVEPSLAGPKRPQDKVALSEAAGAFASALAELGGSDRSQPAEGTDFAVEDGHVVIAAITSCTNTSNPSVMVAAGLVARKARALGLEVKPWVKTSLAPGSQVVSDYLAAAGLQEDLDALGFNLVGYGCTTCIGNSGPLPEPVADAVDEGDLVVGAVLSGNRNFEGRVHAQVRANYLASPPLVVAYAIAGSLKADIVNDPLGEAADGTPVYLKDIWPSNREIADTLAAALTPEMFRARYQNVSEGPAAWRAISSTPSETFDWQDSSTYVRHPTFFEDMGPGTGADRRHRGRARHRDAGGFGHHRPHLAGRQHRAPEPGGRLPAGTPGAPGGVQLIRFEARQPRDHDARHLRQYPHPQRDGAGDRGRDDTPHRRRRSAADLRGGDALPRTGRAAGRGRGQGVRHRLVARLGGQGNPAARHPGGDRRELRAHPPLEPGRHGRAAARVQAGHDAKDAQPRRLGNLRHFRRRGRHNATHGRRLPDRPGRRVVGGHRAHLPDRYAGRGGVLPPRRHPAIRDPQYAGSGLTRPPVQPDWSPRASASHMRREKAAGSGSLSPSMMRA